MTAGINVVQEEPAAPAVPSMPSFPPPTAAPAAPAVNGPAPSTPDLPMTPAGGMETVHISDVQRVALNGILTMHNADYESLAREAFDSKGITAPVPDREQLTYEQAVVVIKYGNDKFKKNR
jgi:hypothetical protein